MALKWERLFLWISRYIVFLKKRCFPGPYLKYLKQKSKQVKTEAPPVYVRSENPSYIYYITFFFVGLVETNLFIIYYIYNIYIIYTAFDIHGLVLILPILFGGSVCLGSALGFKIQGFEKAVSRFKTMSFNLHLRFMKRCFSELRRVDSIEFLKDKKLACCCVH